MDHAYTSLKGDVHAHIRPIQPDDETRGISKRRRNIGLASFTLAIPMVLFTSVLIGLIFSYRVTETKSIYPQLQISSRLGESSAYFVNLNSTLLVFIASWSSSIATILVGFALSLYSYSVARSIDQNVKMQQIDLLPTPYQLNLLLQFFSGGSINALWSWFRYSWGWKQRSRSATLVSKTAAIAVLTFILAFIVFCGDTWLHITTKTVSLQQITPLTEGINYGFILTDPCATNDAANQTSIIAGCIIDFAGTNVFLSNATAALMTLNNVSDTMRVQAHQNSQTAYLGVPPTPDVLRRDYTASTFGIKTQCQLVSQRCNLNMYAGSSTPFNCSEVFAGDLTSGLPWQQAYFSDEAMSSGPELSNIIENPYYHGLAARLNPHGESYLRGESGDPELITPMHGGLAFVLLCDSTVLDVTYDSINGTLTRFVTVPSNNSVTNIWQGAISETFTGTEILQQALNLATISNSSQEMADKFALAYSRVAMGVAVGAVVPRPASAAQQRTTLLVARVPKAPLYTLIVANLSFVVLGICLTITALRASSNRGTREVQARLSISALTANHLGGRLARSKAERTEELFDEYHGGTLSKVAITSAPEGGYKFQVYTEMTASS